MRNKSLLERCKISSGKGENSFVGIKIENDDVFISFPMGYNLDESEDKKVRREILSLLHVLQKFNSNKQNEQARVDNTKNLLEFPLLSYQYVILDYLKNGYYTEKEVAYRSENKGKINWKRTIQQKKPHIDSSNAVYLDFIVKKNIVNENVVLTRIHEYCVFHSFLKLGWLYTDMLPTKPRMKFNQKMFTSVLQTAISQTYNDNKKRLFIAMLNIINNMNEGNALSSECYFGTTSFEYVWEKMIDFVFGESDKSNYFPKARWQLDGVDRSIESSSLQPDTIIKKDDKVFIIDAKYYKYCITENPNDLPSSSSIQKQITYGEYLESDIFKNNYNQGQSLVGVYNAFLMPFAKTTGSDTEYKSIGIATADWKSSDKSYEKVVGVLLDTKYLINNCSRMSNPEIEKLSNMIEKRVIIER